jgi:hypothetical protein
VGVRVVRNYRFEFKRDADYEGDLNLQSTETRRRSSRVYQAHFYSDVPVCTRYRHPSISVVGFDPCPESPFLEECGT